MLLHKEISSNHSPAVNMEGLPRACPLSLEVCLQVPQRKAGLKVCVFLTCLVALGQGTPPPSSPPRAACPGEEVGGRPSYTRVASTQPHTGIMKRDLLLLLLFAAPGTSPALACQIQAGL